MRMRSLFLSICLLLGYLLAPAARAEESCLKCHGDPAAEAKRVVDKPLGRPFSSTAYAQGAHAQLSCAECHTATEPGGFEALPHRMKPSKPCSACHAGEHDSIQSQVRASHHVVKLGDRFTCAACHDPHVDRKADAFQNDLERVQTANRACVRCHGNAEYYYAFAGKDVRPPDISHAWLAVPKRHLERMRCIVCHTPLNRTGIHTVLPRSMGQRDCQGCHSEDPEVARKYLPPSDARTWITNAVLFEKAYVVGATRNRLVDGVLIGLLALTALGILLHALLRLLTASRRKRGAVQVKRTYLYRFSTRLWHGSNALLFVILAFTGFRLHFGGREEPGMSFETAWNIHNLAGALMLVTLGGFWISNALNGNWRQYFQRVPQFMSAVYAQVYYYLVGIFRGEEHPTHATAERKFNALQQVTYAAVLYILMPILAVTGVVLLFDLGSAEGLLGIPGAGAWAILHYLVAAAGVLFLLGHLYLITFGDRLSYGLRGILTGWHLHEEAVVEPVESLEQAEDQVLESEPAVGEERDDAETP